MDALAPMGANPNMGIENIGPPGFVLGFASSPQPTQLWSWLWLAAPAPQRAGSPTSGPSPVGWGERPWNEP